jgi:methanol--5-hydroxybenzimidazolylcobamide Co-methyltransferase
MLAYDCRLMNTATTSGGALTLRQWLVDSDEHFSPQAAVLSPQSTVEIALAIVGADTHYHATMATELTAVRIMRTGTTASRTALNKQEAVWLDRIETELQSMPADETELLEEMSRTHAGVFDPSSYRLN